MPRPGDIVSVQTMETWARYDAQFELQWTINAVLDPENFHEADAEDSVSTVSYMLFLAQRNATARRHRISANHGDVGKI
jgi:hypothetical protein